MPSLPLGSLLTQIAELTYSANFLSITNPRIGMLDVLTIIGLHIMNQNMLGVANINEKRSLIGNRAEQAHITMARGPGGFKTINLEQGTGIKQ